MRKVIPILLLVLAALASGFAPGSLLAPSAFAQEGSGAAGSGATFKIVVNSANSVASENKATLSKLFLKKVREWGSSKEKVTPFDLDEKAAARQAFSEAIHGKSISAIKSYWQRMIFSGRDVPPDELASEEAMLQKIAADKSAIGYVSSKTALPEGVKELTVSDL